MVVLLYGFIAFTVLLLSLLIYTVSVNEIVSINAAGLLSIICVWILYGVWLLFPTNMMIIIGGVLTLIFGAILYSTPEKHIVFHYSYDSVGQIIDDSFDMLLTDTRKNGGVYRFGSSGAIIKHRPILSNLSIGIITFMVEQPDKKTELVRNLVVKRFHKFYPTININLNNT